MTHHRVSSRPDLPFRPGNGDMHLRHFSLLAGLDGTYRLAPAYDLVCTRLVIPDDHLALAVGGKHDHLTRADWVQYGRYCGLRPRVIERVLGRIGGPLAEAQDLVTRALLSDDSKARYSSLLAAYTKQSRE